MDRLIDNEKIYVTPAEVAEDLPEAAEKFCVYSKESDSAVGNIGILRYDEWGLDGVIFFTAPEFRRNGFAASAIHSLTRWYYDSRTADMLIAAVELENVPAIRTLERAGYEYIRSTKIQLESDDEPRLYHLYVCTRSTADAGAPPKGCCCGCGGHTDNE